MDKERVMKANLLAGAATLMATAMIGSASANTISFTVDCSKGQTIGAALQRGDPHFTGTVSDSCTGFD